MDQYNIYNDNMLHQTARPTLFFSLSDSKEGQLIGWGAPQSVQSGLHEQCQLSSASLIEDVKLDRQGPDFSDSPSPPI